MKPLRDGETNSLWVEAGSVPFCPSLDRNIRADVCVVGAGIAGLTTAYLLMKEGKSVCVLESFEIGSGQTGRTTAHFSNALDDRYFEIEKHFGESGARIAAKSHTAAIQKVIEIVNQEKISCDLETVDGYLFAAEDKRGAVLEAELAAAHRAGLSEVELVETSPLSSSSFSTGQCLRFPRQMQLHPLKYIKSLAKLITDGGGQIYTRTHVDHIEGGDRAFVKAGDYLVHCDAVVVATNTPINDRFAIHTKQAPYRTYVLGFKIPKSTVPKALYWDTLDPYHYIRVEAKGDHDVLIVGGEDHKTGQDSEPEKRFVNLDRWSRVRFPMIEGILYSWSGQVMEPVDGMGYLGRNPMDKDNVFIITGDSGNGMTHSTVGAMLITDLIMARPNEWEKLYDPSRISVYSAPEFMKENANVIAQYGDWFQAKSKDHLEQLPVDEGVVVRDGFKMIAAYRDKGGDINLMSAACTHLGGVVRWNTLEKSWDCPCHGSRFNAHGEVIEGPAFKDLQRMSDDEVSEDLWRRKFESDF